MIASKITIREIEPSEANYTTLARLVSAIWPEHPITAEELRHSDERRNPKYIKRRFLAEHDDQAVACANFGHLDWAYNPQRFFISVDVLPEYRGQGIGTALYDHLMTCLVDDYNAFEIFAFTTENRTDSRQFLQKRGFVETMREWESRLDTAQFDPAPFERLDEKMRSLGVEIRTLAELAADPDCYRKLYELECVLEQDVPASREVTFPEFEDWLKKRSETYPGFLPDAFYIALYEGLYIGVSFIYASQATDNLYTGLTGVLRDYRHKGIATAMKLRAIDYARQLGNRTIITWNEQSNPMLNINLRLGFVKQPAEIEFCKKLGDLS